ncbi:Receptor-like protein [Melia azedarach]|uniref:Receptor-like protein n=1 Tax=Melia azedarach TaxID=155640 RepID=A0ACC1YHZ6_MELAZ|nr:Receptor-like protein [Melia azedarach]
MGLSQFFFLLFLQITFAYFTSFASSSLHPVCHDNERSALLQFKHSLIIDEYASGEPSAYPKTESWKTDKENSNCCLWDGVKCDEYTGHVTKLDLASSYLYGSINSSSTLFHLVHLQWLSLADNNFNSSSIPSGILNLKQLSYLSLSESSFSGQIPVELLELSKLVSLDLSYNNYYSKLQNHSYYYYYLELQNLTNLAEKLINLNELDLSYVKISSPIPPALTNLSSLTFLSLRGCGLHGAMPYSVGNLRKLVSLDISYNLFQGQSLPTSLGNLKSLSSLDITFSSFSGIIPPSLGNLTQLDFLAMKRNYFLGLNSYSLTWIANLKKLTFLDLSSNDITGKFPSVLMNLTQLNWLLLYDNWLTGPIPSWLMNLNKLSGLYLQLNLLTGHIPVEIRNLTQLQALSLQSNMLQGSIPSSIFELKKNLQRLDLSFNNLSGTVEIDNFLLNMKNLLILSLSSNKLSLVSSTSTTVNATFQNFEVIGLGSCNLSEFPYFLHDQDRLNSLDLSSNNIAGQVPGWFLDVSPYYLVYLNLSSNLLTGFEQNPIPLPWIFLDTLDLRFNKLQGPLPIPSVYTYSYLVSNNQLVDEIPPQICNLSILYALDVSYNNLSGMLPKCLGNFSYQLSILKLQGNNFHGSIPETFMKGTDLMMLDLSNNSLQGKLPKSLANCKQLKFLNLGINQITDIFPSWLGTLPKLEVLILKFNRFYGVIREPKTSFEFPKLRIIDLSQNSFTGTLPSKYFRYWNAMKDVNATELTYLRDLLLSPRHAASTFYGYFDYSLTMSNKGTDMEYKKLSNLITAVILSNNKFVGEIPATFADLKGLRSLNLSNNNLEGHIPSSLSNLKVLESLDLSHNKPLRRDSSTTRRAYGTCSL